MSTTAKSWDFIESSFADSIEMLQLVKHIKNSGVSNRIFGIVSLDKLVVSIYSEIELDREAIHVRFDNNSCKWEFHYNAIPFKPPEFNRVYDRNLGIEKFDLFIKMLNW